MSKYYSPFSKFILRTPSLPFSKLDSLKKEMSGPSYDNMGSFIREAIYIASPTLYRDLIHLGNNEYKASEKKKKKVKESYFKYLNRMSSRSTPFGLFSSCSVGKIAGDTKLSVSSSLLRKTRLDTNLILEICNKLNQIPEVRNKVKFFPNNTLYKVNGYYRYIEQKVVANNSSFSIASVKTSLALTSILRKAQQGVLFNELVTELEILGVEREDAVSYIEELIGANLILSELTPSLTTNDNLFPLPSIVRIFNGAENIFSSIRKTISELDLRQVNAVSEYQNIYEKVRSITESENEENSLLQIDLLREANELRLGPEIIKELQDVLGFFIDHSNARGKSVIKEFQEAFYNRYDDQEVPLTIALDPDLGIGYPVNYGVSDNPHKIITSLEALSRRATHHPVRDSVNDIILSKLNELQNNDTIQINIKDIKRDGVGVTEQLLPDTIYVFFQILKNQDNQPLLYVKGVGAGGANLFSRFSHLHKDIKSLINEVTRKEEEMQKDSIVAEIIHLPPNSRVGNILKRGSIRTHEIEFFAMSELDQECRIPISDIMISIKGGSIYLRSKKNNKRVIPKLTTAHNFYNGTLSIYKFLCDLQYNNTISGFEVDSKSIAKNRNFIPRICVGKTIVSLATWILYESDFQGLTDVQSYNSFIKDWRLKRKVPEKVLLISGDNELLIEFSCTLSVDILLSEIRKRKTVEIKEFLFEKDNLPIKGEQGNYLNECIVPFYRI